MNKKLLIIICAFFYGTAALADEPKMEPVNTPYSMAALADESIIESATTSIDPIEAMARENEELTKDENDIYTDFYQLLLTKKEEGFKSFSFEETEQDINATDVAYINLESFLKKHAITKKQFNLILNKREIFLKKRLHIERYGINRLTRIEMMVLPFIGAQVATWGPYFTVASHNILENFPQSKWAQLLFNLSKLPVAVVAAITIFLVPLGVDIVFRLIGAITSTTKKDQSEYDNIGNIKARLDMSKENDVMFF